MAQYALAPFFKCSSCGVKFYGNAGDEHVAGSKDCHEWREFRLNEERFRD